MERINSSIKEALDRRNVTKSHPEYEIAGGIGFPEGAQTLSMRLWEQQQDMLPFATMSCCFFPSQASSWLNARAQDVGLMNAHINIPTLYIHGNRDFCLGHARKLVRTHYQPQCATVIQTEAGHHYTNEERGHGGGGQVYSQIVDNGVSHG